MANYVLDYSAISTLDADFATMNQTLQKRLPKIAKKIGEELKRNVERFIPKEKGAPKWGIHAADEVKYNFSYTQSKAKITVQGGKKTGPLWWLIDNGHVATNGHFIPGAHFTDKAYNATDVNTVIDELLNEVASK